MAFTKELASSYHLAMPQGIYPLNCDHPLCDTEEENHVEINNEKGLYTSVYVCSLCTRLKTKLFRQYIITI